MRGVWGVVKSLALLTALTLTLAVAVAPTYVKDHQYCYTEFDQTITTAIAGFTGGGVLPTYEYIGAKYSGTGTTFSKITCRDVTRVVTQLKVTESEYVTAAGNSTLENELNTNVTKQLTDAAGTYADLNGRLVHVTATLNRNASDNTSAIFNVEYVMKGYDDQLEAAVGKLKTETLVGGTLSEVGTVDTTGMTFTVQKCPGGPPVAPTNGAVSDQNGFAGERVTYTCNTGYRLTTKTDKLVWTCDHTEVIWKYETATVACEIDLRCMSDPPAPPNHATRKWNGVDKEDGEAINYYCIDDYKSVVTDQSISNCTNKSWTAIPSSFICEFNGCQHPPPQVVDNGEINWGNSRVHGTKASYFCKTGFVSTVYPDPELICKTNVWDILPKTYRCIRSELYDDEIEEVDYFVIITIPTVAGLSLAIFICLCCTRTDSPFCRCCSDRGKNPSFA